MGSSNETDVHEKWMLNMSFPNSISQNVYEPILTKDWQDRSGRETSPIGLPRNDSFGEEIKIVQQTLRLLN